MARRRDLRGLTALRLAAVVRRHGGTVEPKRRTGEWVWSHPEVGQVVSTCGTRRKRPSRVVLVFAHRVVDLEVSDADST